MNFITHREKMNKLIHRMGFHYYFTQQSGRKICEDCEEWVYSRKCLFCHKHQFFHRPLVPGRFSIFTLVSRS